MMKLKDCAMTGPKPESPEKQIQKKLMLKVIERNELMKILKMQLKPNENVNLEALNMETKDLEFVKISQKSILRIYQNLSMNIVSSP